MYATQIKSGIFDRVDVLHMSESERLRVSAYPQDGERIAEFCFRALANIRSGAELAGYAAVGLARGVKALFVKPARALTRRYRIRGNVLPAASESTASAMSSKGVGSALTITTRAPADFASDTAPAIG